METPKKVVMRCGGAKCCPELVRDDKWIRIKDDFGNEVKIPRKDEEAFREAVSDLLDG